jgi:methylmalonyl-CoA mutase cobalamin-binding subunit
MTRKLGRRPKILVGKRGLNGHSNGEEQVAVRERDDSMDVVNAGVENLTIKGGSEVCLSFQNAD